jgi:hypothetical protein
MTNPLPKRVLALDPFSRGVGYAVLEGRDNLVDWGLKTTRRADNHKASRAIESLLEWFQSDVLAIEDWNAADSRRCRRVEVLLDQIASVKQKRLQVRLITRRELRMIGPQSQTNTKYGRACLIADHFQELRPFLPRFRKPWMPEDDRMAIFDAVGFALAYLENSAGPATDPTKKIVSRAATQDAQE